MVLVAVFVEFNLCYLYFSGIPLNLNVLVAQKLGKVECFCSHYKSVHEKFYSYYVVRFFIDWLKPSVRSNPSEFVQLDLAVIKSRLIRGNFAIILQEVVETLAPNMSTGESDPAAVPAESPHGIEVGVEFKPVEHPVEPLNLDEPVKCPLPEPSILHVSHPLSAY
jgi:hypothetical protein